MTAADKKALEKAYKVLEKLEQEALQKHDIYKAHVISTTAGKLVHIIAIEQ